MLGSPEKRNPAARNGRAQEMDRARRPITEQGNSSLRDRQARYLAASFALSLPVACLVAERAFGLVEEVR